MRRTVIAIALGATACVIVGAIGASLAGSLPGAFSASVLSASRGLAIMVGIATAAAFLLGSAGRRRTGLALFGSAAGIASLWIALISGRVPDRPPLVLLESDREGLVEIEIDGRRWVAHRTLGFRLPQPSVTLAPSDEVARAIAQAGGPGFTDAHQIWAFESEDRGLTVVIDLSRAERVDRAGMERLLDAIAGSARPSTTAFEVSPIEIRGRCANARLGGDLPGGGRLEGRVFGFEERRSRRAFHLAITIVGPASARAREYLEEVVSPCAETPD